jgi:hypothetical protein
VAAGNHHQMTRIVTYAHRYKRPPRKRNAVATEAPTTVSQIRHAKKPHEVTNRSAQDGCGSLVYLKQIKE